MESLTGKVAVVTGAASGIGRSLADRFVTEGMKVVLADVEEGALEAATREIVDTGAEAVGVPCDVSSRASVDALAEVAGMVVDAISSDRFYVLTHPEMIKPHVEQRFRPVLDGTDPPAGSML